MYLSGYCFGEARHSNQESSKIKGEALIAGAPEGFSRDTHTSGYIRPVPIDLKWASPENS